MFRRKFLKNITALSALSLTGCGWKLGNVRTQAAVQGQRDQLYLYTWTQYTDDKELLKAFTAQTGIRLFTDVYGENEAMLAKMLAGGGGAYSVIYPSDYAVQKMVANSLLSEINHERLVGVENLFPQFQNPPYDPNNRYSIPFTWGTTGFIYNSEVLTNPPDDWEYLWINRDKLKGKMTLLSDAREVMGGALRMLGYSYNSQSEAEIKQAYERLKELIPLLADFDSDAWRNQILAGDLLLAMCYSSDGIKINKENPKFKYVIPKSGTSLWTDTLVISKTAPNIDGAYAWINYLLQPEVSAQLTKTQSLATPNRSAFELLPRNIQTKSSLFPPQELIVKCERIASVGQADELYDRYWNQLTSE